VDYKKLIKSREVRVRLMRLLSFVPDRLMVQIQYYIKTGRKLNLKNPQRFTEKLQWYKLYYRDPLMQRCVDKFDVREYVRECGYGGALVELLGVYDTPEEIDFTSLPNQFVIKDTLGGGGNSVIICKDKETLDIPLTKERIKRWIEPVQGKHPGREWVYDQEKNRIIIEKYIDSDEQTGGLVDYKFFCFGGKVAYVYGIADRALADYVNLGIFTPDFELLPYRRIDERPLTRKLKKPINYEQMVACAEKLSRPFPHARVDLYNVDGKILFGEITFFDGSGYMKYDPDEFDFVLGNAFELPPKLS